MKKISPYNINQFARYMERKYNVKIINKKDPRILAVETILKAMGIKHIDDWLENWSMCVGNVVYLSFTPGIIAPCKPSLTQQAAIITRECVRSVQQRKPRFWVRYLSRSDWRTAYEIAAVKAEWEIEIGLVGPPVGSTWPFFTARRLRKYYKIKASDAKEAKIVLKSYAKHINRGNTSQPVAKDALAWWQGLRG